MKHQLIVSIDTGECFVGIFTYYRNFYDKPCYTIHQLAVQGDLSNRFKQVALLLKRIIDDYAYEMMLQSQQIDVQVIIEDFINYTHKQHIKGFKQNLTSEMNGWLKQWVSENGFKWTTQTASQAKIFTNERLIKLNLLQEVNKKFYLNGNPIPKHTRDAYRHFIYYTNKHWFNKCITFEKVFN